MSHRATEKGFMKAFIVITIAFCIVFIFLFKFSQYFGQGLPAVSRGGGVSLNPRTQSDYLNTGSGVNPLLDFGDSFGSGWQSDQRIAPNHDGVLTSPYAGTIRLSTGNARTTAQPYEEYVTLVNRGQQDVNITGWRLANGKGSRPIQNAGNDYFYPSADLAVIGQGTEFLNPTGGFQVGDIVLKKGDKAVVTTGGPFTQYAFSIPTSFRENICLGYLPDFPFTPRVSPQCPSLASDPLTRTLTDECYDYVRSLNRCENPTDRPTKKEREEFELLSNQCQSFIRERAGYASCVTQNVGRADFSINQWRVFLGKSREMWSNSRDTITLYDSSGLIVDQVSY